MLVICAIFLALACRVEALHAFGASLSRTNRMTRISSSFIETEIVGTQTVQSLNPKDPYSFSVEQLKDSILRVAATSNRGENSDRSEKEKVLRFVQLMEGQNPTDDPAMSDIAYGTWDLVYSDTNLFRSSPFFMAGRAVCEQGEQADRFNQFCDLHRAALAHTQIGKVRQIVSASCLVSEFETVGAVVPGLPFVIRGTIESTADIVSTEAGNAWVLNMRSTKIKTGTSNVPLLKNILDNSEGLPIQRLRSLLENVPAYTNPQPVFRSSFTTKTCAFRETRTTISLSTRM